MPGTSVYSWVCKGPLKLSVQARASLVATRSKLRWSGAKPAPEGRRSCCGPRPSRDPNSDPTLTVTVRLVFVPVQWSVPCCTPSPALLEAQHSTKRQTALCAGGNSEVSPASAAASLRGGHASPRRRRRAATEQSAERATDAYLRAMLTRRAPMTNSVTPGTRMAWKLPGNPTASARRCWLWVMPSIHRCALSWVSGRWT